MHQIELGKQLIALALKQCEILDRLLAITPNNWYDQLFEALIDESANKKFEDNQITIVTYNYDRSLEATLFHRVKNRFDLTDDQAFDELARLKIIHLHGILGPFPDIPYSHDSQFDTAAKANQISIIPEIKDQDEGFCSPKFKEAHDAIENACRIIFLGFGFHSDNVKRLKIKSWGKTVDNWIPQVMLTANFDGKIARNELKALLPQLGFTLDDWDVPNCKCYELFLNFIDLRACP